jgi:hypothetical protein
MKQWTCASHRQEQAAAQVDLLQAAINPPNSDKQDNMSRKNNNEA